MKVVNTAINLNVSVASPIEYIQIRFRCNANVLLTQKPTFSPNGVQVRKFHKYILLFII